MAYDTSKLASLQALKDTATRIKKEYLAAISKAGHASFQKAEAIPTAEEAQENILYLVKNTETNHYDIYALVDGAVELLDDTTVNLDGCVTDEELAAALAGLGGGALYEGTKLGKIAEEATKTEKSDTNGCVKINGVDTEVYKEPTDVIHGSIATDDEVTEMLNEVFTTTSV